MKRYIFLLNENNQPMCGTDNTSITHYKMFSYLIKQAQMMLNHSRFGVVAYLMNDYTQKMCEMGSKELGEYIIKNGRKLTVK